MLFCVQAKRGLTGIMNFTNPGAVSHNEVGVGVVSAPNCDTVLQHTACTSTAVTQNHSTQ